MEKDIEYNYNYLEFRSRYNNPHAYDSTCVYPNYILFFETDYALKIFTICKN